MYAGRRGVVLKNEREGASAVRRLFLMCRSVQREYAVHAAHGPRGGQAPLRGDFIEKGVANHLRICYNPKRCKNAAGAGLIRADAAEAAELRETAGKFPGA